MSGDRFDEDEIEAAFGWQDRKAASLVATVAAADLIEVIGWSSLVENSPQLQWQIALAEADKTGGTEKIRELLRSGLSLDKRNRAALADLLELKKFGGEREGKLGLNRTAEQQEYLRAMVEFFRLSESDGPLSRVQQMVAARVQKFGESEADALAHVMASTDGVAAYEQDELEKAGRALEQAGATF